MRFLYRCFYRLVDADQVSNVYVGDEPTRLHGSVNVGMVSEQMKTRIPSAETYNKTINYELLTRLKSEKLTTCHSIMMKVLNQKYNT